MIPILCGFDASGSNSTSRCIVASDGAGNGDDPKEGENPQRSDGAIWLFHRGPNHSRRQSSSEFFTVDPPCSNPPSIFIGIVPRCLEKAAHRLNHLIPDRLFGGEICVHVQ